MAFNFSSGWQSTPPVTRHLILINLLIWLVEVLTGSFGNLLVDKLGLHMIGATMFNPVQIITYMFLHDQGSVLHVLFNMFSLWMFGRVLEQVWGSRRYFVFYMVCGIGAALVQEAVWLFTWRHDYITAIAQANHITYAHMESMVNNALAVGDTQLTAAMDAFQNMMVTIGASGAVFGLLLGFAMTFPDMPLYLFFIPIPIKAKYMVIAYAVLEFFLGVSGGGTIAHFAHLGGMIFGLILLLYWKKKGTLRGNGFY